MKSKIEKIHSSTNKASLVIAVSGLISKILAAVYRVPYQNLVGNRGFYAYQQIYPLLAIITALSLTALPNLIASISHSKKRLALSTLFKCQLISCIGLALILISFHRRLAFGLGSAQLAPSIILTALVLLTVPFNSFYRGLAQSQMKMLPTAMSQVIEQLVRVSIIIVAAICYGLFNWTVYFTANVAASGNLLASVCVLFYLKKKSHFSLSSLFLEEKMSFKDLTNISLSSLIFIFYSIYLLLFQFIDALYVKNSLVRSDTGEFLSEISKGIYDRGQPLVQFGLIVTTAFFTTYLPHLSKKYHDNKEAYKEDSQVFFDFIFYLNVTLTVGYLCILSSMNKFLFKTNEGWDALAIYISIIFFSSLIQFFHQKLFIENKQSLSFVILSIGLLVKIGLTPLLTYYYSILGSSLSTLLPLILVLLLYGYHSDIDYHALTNVRYAISLFIMTFSVILLQFVLPKQTRIDNFCSLIVATSCGLGLFLYSAKKLEAFDQKLWSYLPFNKEK